jgi:hypothetical protein
MERRLARMEVVYRRRERSMATTRYDTSALSPFEQYELDGLLAKIEQRPRRPNGRPDYSGLSDDELDRMTELAEKMQEASHEP